MNLLKKLLSLSLLFVKKKTALNVPRPDKKWLILHKLAVGEKLMKARLKRERRAGRNQRKLKIQNRRMRRHVGTVYAYEGQYNDADNSFHMPPNLEEKFRIVPYQGAFIVFESAKQGEQPFQKHKAVR